MGPTTFNGLPAHVLFVHFVVALVPLSALLLALSVCWPAARRRLGVITPAVALVTLILVPITTHAGEWLKRHTDPDPLVRAHAALGDQLLYWSIGVFIVSAIWWVLHADRLPGPIASRLRAVRGLAANRVLATTLIIAAVVLAVGSCVQLYRIGDSGAKAVWHDQVTSASAAP